MASGLAVRAADEQQLALAMRAQNDYDRVERAAGPELSDASRCQQSQAALLPVAQKPEIAMIHFRKGYCAAEAALITRNAGDFREAANELERAVEAWPESAAAAIRYKGMPEPVPSPLRVLVQVVRLRSGLDAGGMELARKEIAAAVEPAICSTTLMPAGNCQAILETGRLWLGWFNLGSDDLDRATKEFAATSNAEWRNWTAGKIAYRDHRYSEAAARYSQAVEGWQRAQRQSSRPLAQAFAPQPDMPQALADLGGTQFLAGDPSAAISTLDVAVKAAPNRPRALYLRARAEEKSGQSEQALTDYSLASRTALASAQDLASGEAHLYRGILLYRRKDFEHAENEFATALNFDISTALRPDAVAWRHMAAVASGSCGMSRESLESSLAAVSPYFPKDEARAIAGSCPLTTASTSGV
jgi:tetratricopeptide (TPR) repeat protein